MSGESSLGAYLSANPAGRLLPKSNPPGRPPKLMTDNQNSMPKRLWSAIPVALFVLASPILAQQPAAPSPSSQQSSGTQDPVGEKGGEKRGDRKGKSKLEIETGTVNDRLFEALPNYGTVENAKKLPPISTGQKFSLATAGVFDYATYPFIGFLAAIDQANNSPQSWGQGWGAYGQRYGASFADNCMATYMTSAIFPSLLREDPRYYQQGRGRSSSRAWYSFGRLFVARTDSGHPRFNYSEFLGNAAAAGISNLYHAPEDRTFARNMGTLGMLVMWDGVSNELREFWPDIRRKVFHKKLPEDE